MEHDLSGELVDLDLCIPQHLLLTVVELVQLLQGQEVVVEGLGAVLFVEVGVEVGEG